MSVLTDKKARLKNLLLRLSYEQREVVLASGQKSNFYFDGKQTSLHPEGACLLGELLYDAVRALPELIEAVGGPTLGADPLVTAVALVSHQKNDPIPAFIIRKEPKKHGTGQWLEGIKNLREGACVAILEDVVTSGSSSLEAVAKAREYGLKVVAVVSIVDRGQGGAQAILSAGLTFSALFTKDELLAGT